MAVVHGIGLFQFLQNLSEFNGLIVVVLVGKMFLCLIGLSAADVCFF
jgi:hypothetical protein